MDIKKPKNMFSLEGIDGAGKSTQAPLVKSTLQERGYEVKILKSPDETLLGKFIRNNVKKIDPWLRNELFLLDIKNSLKKIEDGSETIFLWDRYIDSFYSSNEEMSLSEANNLTKNLPKPNKTFLLNINPETVLKKRKEVLDHHSVPKWLRQKNERYKELSRIYPDRFSVIDATLPIDKVTQKITNKIIKEV